jgi:hypothetical protein
VSLKDILIIFHDATDVWDLKSSRRSVFWDMTPCNYVNGYERFGGTRSLLFNYSKNGTAYIFNNPED